MDRSDTAPLQRLIITPPAPMPAARPAPSSTMTIAADAPDKSGRVGEGGERGKEKRMFDKILKRKQYLVRNEKLNLYACADPAGWGRREHAKPFSQETARQVATLLSYAGHGECRAVHEDEIE